MKECCEKLTVELKENDLSAEAWREYEFGDKVYRINNPSKLYYRVGGSTHRVLDQDGVVHCVPAPGFNGCVLRWKNLDSAPSPCQF